MRVKCIYFPQHLAPSMKEFFNGDIPALTDPALAISRLRRKLVCEVRNENNPHGNELEGEIFIFMST